MKLYEIHFTFTPTDNDGIGEGLITVSADTEDDAKERFAMFLDGLSDVEIIEIREVVDNPNLLEADYVPRTLQ